MLGIDADGNAIAAKIEFRNEGVATAFPQNVTSEGAGTDVAPLTLDDVSALLPQAQQYWIDAGASASVVRSAVFQIADLPTGYAGQSQGTQITLDASGAGWGWFVDRSPGESSEFQATSLPNDFTAPAGSDAAHKLDLLTVMIHELGHVLGMPSTMGGDGVMSQYLAPGDRRLPDAADIVALQAEGSPNYVGGPKMTIAQAAPVTSTSGNEASAQTTSVPDNARFDATGGWVREGVVNITGDSVTLNESATRQTHLAQGFIVNQGDRVLSFTVAGQNLAANANGPSDAFEVALLDANTGLPLAGTVGLTRTDALLNLQTNGTERLAQVVRKIVNADGSATYYIDLPQALAGKPVLLSFDLLSFGAAQSSVSLRDIRVISYPVASDDLVTTDEDTTVTGNLLGNDITGGIAVAQVERMAEPAHGTLSVAEDGSFSYVPEANYFGADSFSYRLVDAEGRVSNTATVSLTVRPVNDAPVAPAASVVSVIAGKPFTFDPLAGATDVEGGSLSVQWVSQPAHGSLVANADGSYTYTADADYVGADTFSWRVSDGELVSESIASFSVTIEAANSAPVARDTSLALAEDGVLDIDPDALGTDADGDPLSFMVVSQPAHGSLARQSNGHWRYTPAANFNGSDSFSYRLNDGKADSAIATVALVISAVNDAPSVESQTLAAVEDVPFDGDLLRTASDIDSSMLTASVIAGPLHGVLTVHADGTFTYVSDRDYFGEDRFTYTVNDGQLGSGVATVVLNIDAVNDAPVVADVALTVAANGQAVVTPVVNDVDTLAADLRVAIVRQAQHGTVTQLSDGSWRYTAAAGYAGSDSFTYRANDGQLDSNLATVRVTVSPPVATTLDIDLGVAGQFNAFVFHDFTSSGSDTEGAIAVGNRLDISNYSVNEHGMAYHGYSAVVGGELNFVGGSLHGTASYGTVQHTGQLSPGDTVTQTAPDFSFADEQARLTALSDQLAALPATGTIVSQWGGLTFTGDGSSGVQVFNISGADLMSANYSNFANLTPGQTVIVNVTGDSGFTGGTPNGFAAYNTLFNFNSANILNFNNVGVTGSILAPRATVSGGGGQINGNVVVKDWNSGIQINANHFFQRSSVELGNAHGATTSRLATASMGQGDCANEVESESAIEKNLYVSPVAFGEGDMKKVSRINVSLPVADDANVWCFQVASDVSRADIPEDSAMFVDGDSASQDA